MARLRLLRPDSFARLTRRLLYSNPFAYWHLPPPSSYLKIEPEGSKIKKEGRKEVTRRKKKRKGREAAAVSRAHPPNRFQFLWLRLVLAEMGDERSIACEAHFIHRRRRYESMDFNERNKKKKKKIKFQRQSQRKGLNFKSPNVSNRQWREIQKSPPKKNR